MRILWITNAWSSLHHHVDTSLRILEEARKNGIDCYWSDWNSISIRDSEVVLKAGRVEKILTGRSPDDFIISGESWMAPHAFDNIQFRVDPPIDSLYVNRLQLIALSIRKARMLHPSCTNRTVVVNSPDSLMNVNSKFEGTLLANLAPRSLVTAEWDAMQEFGIAERSTVLKPTNGAQSKGVRLLKWDCPTAVRESRELLVVATRNFSRPVVLQQYLDTLTHGENRLWYLDGKVLAVAKKRSRKEHFVIDMDDGDLLLPTSLNKQEKLAASMVGIHLQDMGVRLAAVDFIEGLITDFNIASPGLLCQFETITNTNLAAKIVKSMTNNSHYGLKHDNFGAT